MLKPAHLTFTARILLGVGTLALAPLMLLPAFQGAEAVLGLSDGQAHCLAFYLLTVTSFAAAPNMRRNDLAIAAVAMGAALEAAQVLTGRQASAQDLLADGVGVALAWLPAFVDQTRRLARSYPGLSLAQISALDRRRRAARRMEDAAPNLEV